MRSKCCIIRFLQCIFEAFLVVHITLFLFIFLSLFFSFDFVDFSALDFHLPFNPINIMLLFPISLFLLVKILPNLIVFSSKTLDFFFNNFDSFLFGFFPFFPFFGILFFFFKDIFLVTLKIFFQTINISILFVELSLDFVILFL